MLEIKTENCGNKMELAVERALFLQLILLHGLSTIQLHNHFVLMFKEVHVKISTPLKLGVLVLITLFNTLLLAQTNAGANSRNKGGPMGGPPPAEALAACKSLTSGKDCSFSTPQGTEKGVCWAPEGKPLACKPNNPKGPPPKQ